MPELYSHVAGARVALRYDRGESNCCGCAVSAGRFDAIISYSIMINKTACKTWSWDVFSAKIYCTKTDLLFSTLVSFNPCFCFHILFIFISFGTFAFSSHL